MRVAVVGGGVVGLSCAFELRQAGADVVVYESGKVGHGSSLGNTGWLCPSRSTPVPGPGVFGEGVRGALGLDSPLAFGPAGLRWLWAFRGSCTRARFLAGTRALVGLSRLTAERVDGYRSAGVEFELHEGGILLVAISTAKLDSYCAVFRDLAEAGFAGRISDVTAGEARELEPSLGTNVVGGAVTEGDRFVEPHSLTTGLATWLRASGVGVREHTTWTGPDGADATVLAPGAGGDALLRRYGVRTGLTPGRGYSVSYARDPGTPSRAVYLADARVAVSPHNAHIRFAGTIELGRRDAKVNKRRLDAMLRSIDRFFDGWQASTQPRRTTWAGLRPMTPDGLPVIGRTPGDARVFVATGHGPLGMTLAPATAGLLAPVVLGEAPSPALAPFDPARRL